MIITQLNEILNSTNVNDIRHHIALYFKKNACVIPTTSITQVANECHVSKSMIVKFVKELGYEGYIDFKNMFYENKSNFSSYSIQEFLLETQLFGKNINNDTLKKLELLVEDILHARCIYAYGQNEYKALCIKLQCDLDQFNIPTIVVDETFHKQYNIKDNSLLLMFNIDQRTLKKINNPYFNLWSISTHDSYERINSLFFPTSINTSFIILNIIEELLVLKINEKVHSL